MNLGNIFDYKNDPDKSRYDGSGNQGGKPRKPMVFYVVIVLCIMLFINNLLPSIFAKNAIKETSYDEFLTQLDKGNLNEVELNDTTIKYTLKEPESRTVYQTGRIDYLGEVDRLYKSGAKFTQEIPVTISPSGCCSTTCCP